MLYRSFIEVVVDFILVRGEVIFSADESFWFGVIALCGVYYPLDMGVFRDLFALCSCIAGDKPLRFLVSIGFGTGLGGFSSIL